jgi:signal transduction histidine kinase
VLDRVTTDLLTTSQAQRGALSVDARTVTVAPVLESARASTDSGDDLVVECAPDLAAHADPVRLGQIVTNLVSNAYKHGAPPVVVRARSDGERVVITVDDSGDGIPEEFRPLLFERYARAPGSRVPGTGLGLYVVRMLARLQGGDAWYEPLATGSRFAVALPAAVVH